MNFNIMMLERKHKTLLPEVNPTNLLSPKVLLTLNEDLKKIGYELSREVMFQALFLSATNFKLWSDEVYKTCLHLVGGDVRHKPLYKDFPIVMTNATYEQLEIDRFNKGLEDMVATYSQPKYFDMLLDALMNYDGISVFNPLKNADLSCYESTEITTEELSVNKEVNDTSGKDKLTVMKMISLTTMEEIESFICDLVSMKGSLSEDDKELLTWVLDQYNEEDVQKFIQNICMKETLIFVYNYFKSKGYNLSQFPIKTATDLLRIVVSDQGLDISLSKKIKFKNVSRSNRRVYLNMLERLCENSTEDNVLIDMMRHCETWKRLNEKLHSFEYAKNTPIAFNLFNRLASNELPKTFDGKVEAAIMKKDLFTCLNLLTSRPGDFARKLNRVLTEFEDDAIQVINAFKEVGTSVPNDILFNLLTFFGTRNDSMMKLFIPKGKMQKAYAKEYLGEKPLSHEVISEVEKTIRDMITLNLSLKDPLGEVYLAPEMKGILLPVNNRSANSSKQTLSRGSKIALSEETKVIRAFLYWVGNDIDLSAIIFTDDFKQLDEIAYYNLRNSDSSVYHSGDIQYASNGASEFIDIDIEKIGKSYNGQARYVGFSAHVFSGPNFINHKQCFMGVMERSNINSKEPFDAKTVKYKFDLTNDEMTCFAMLFDLKERKMIALDLGSNKNRLVRNCLAGDAKRFGNYMRGILETKRPSFYDVIQLNVEARGGQLVDYKEKEVDVEEQVEGGEVPIIRKVLKKRI